MEDSNINVAFYDFTSKKLLANSRVPLKQLPDTFEINTTIHFLDSNWKVMDAQPVKKSDFQKLGNVELVISKVAQPKVVESTAVDPKTVLYSLPSIDEKLPKVIASNQSENILVLFEDDWRQSEFIKSSFSQEIDDEISQIRSVYKNDKERQGFRNMHLRNKISSPLQGKEIQLADLQQRFGVQMNYSTVGFNSSHGGIENGFAFVANCNWVLWGQVSDDYISFLNIIPMANAIIEPFSSKMNDFLQNEDLYFIDWIRMFIAGSNQKSFADFMKY